MSAPDDSPVTALDLACLCEGIRAEIDIANQALVTLIAKSGMSDALLEPIALLAQSLEYFSSICTEMRERGVERETGAP